ncbi:MAG: winged helix-turn-helix domain-containing protein [Candidatus Altiarchaeia archaeon]
MDEDKITLDRETFKALAVDSRVKILRILDDRQHTLTDLAEELGMAPSTIKEHLDTLVAAGLIKQVDKGMKWKYYKLTGKGKELLNPYEKKVWIVLATSLLALGVTAYTLLSRLRGLGKITVIENYLSSPTSRVPENAMQGASEELLKSAPASGAADMLGNATAGSPDGGTGAVLMASFNDSVECISEGCRKMADEITHELERNATKTLSDASTILSTSWDTVTSTLAETARDYAAPPAYTNTQTKIIESATQLPYAEIALFAACALVAGLCIGYLIKKKRRI